MTLKQFVTDPKTGKPRRGSLVRVAEHLGVQKSTVPRWISGEWKPSIARCVQIKEMIHARISLKAKRNPGRPKGTGNKKVTC